MINVALDFGRLVFGVPSVKSISLPKRSGSLEVSQRDVLFLPSPRFSEALPASFSLRFELLESPAGHKRLAPRNGFGGFLANAWLAGALLRAGYAEEVTVDGVEPTDQWLLFQVARGMSQHLDRGFAYSRDIFVRSSSRERSGPRNLLPGQAERDLGIGNWPRSIREFRNMGREAAGNAGYEATPELINAFAFFEVARKQSAPVITDNEMRAVVRRALFDDVDAQPLDAANLQTIRQAAIAILHEHDRDNRRQFETRVLGPHGSFTKQLVARVQMINPMIDRPMVRMGLLEIGWQAYEYIGKCVDAVMTAMEPRLYDVLDAGGIKIFRQVFCSQPVFGDLPLAMLAERLPFLHAAIIHAWDAAHAADVPSIIQRLLLWYGELARRRRAFDRRSKQAGARSIVLQLHGFEKVPQESDVFSNAADHLRERSGVACECKAPEWRYALSSNDEREIMIQCSCDRCEVIRNVAVPRGEFESIVRHLLM